LLVVGGAGNLYVAPGLRLLDAPDFPQAFFAIAQAERELLDDLQASMMLNWAMISPPLLFGPETSGDLPRNGRYRLGEESLLMDGDKPANISRADIAVAIADDVEQKAHLHQNFTVASI
ncbi:MAG: NAD(P)-dependent oxidoreductase, partial [Cardiobacterium hominis]